MWSTVFFLLMLVSSVLSEEVNRNWKETVHHLDTFDCSIPMSLKKYSLPPNCIFPETKVQEVSVPETVPGYIIGEEYVHVISGVVCAATKSCF